MDIEDELALSFCIQFRVVHNNFIRKFWATNTHTRANHLIRTQIRCENMLIYFHGKRACGCGDDDGGSVAESRKHTEGTQNRDRKRLKNGTQFNSIV